MAPMTSSRATVNRTDGTFIFSSEEDSEPTAFLLNDITNNNYEEPVKHTLTLSWLASVLFIAAFAHSPARAQTSRIGFVNSSKILQEFPEAQEANKKLDEMGKAWQAELDRMSKEFEDKLQDYKKKEALMPETEKR